MEWDKLSLKNFKKAIKLSKGLCLLPLGCIEKHGDHLPLGTDSIEAYSVACAAAKREPAVVFPYNCFGAISEGRHQPGTIALRYELLIPFLENICDEISRNGFKKILVVNFHGGNSRLLIFFMGLLLEKCKPYSLYYSDAWIFKPEEFKNPTTDKNDGHGGEMETSLMMYLHPDIVKAPAASENGMPKGDFKHLKDRLLKTGADWYSDYPNHLATDGTPGTARKGAECFKIFTNNLISQIKTVKADNAVKTVFENFHNKAKNPL